MFVHVIQMQLKHCSAFEANLFWRESVLPELKLQRGWKDASFAPIGTGKVMLFTVWDTKEAARGFNATPDYHSALAQFIGLGRDIQEVVYPLGTAEEYAYARCKAPEPHIN